MSMKKGNLIEVNDVPEAIRSYITSYLNRQIYEGTVGYAQFGTKKALWAAVENELATRGRPSSGGEITKGGLIKIADVRNMMVYAMQEASRVHTITYQAYKSTGYTNSKSWPSKETHTYTGVMSSPVISEAAYLAKFPASSFPQPGTIIRAVDITNLLDAMKAYSIANQGITNKGLVNSCYSSCHTNCHGSSRSRR